MGLKNAALQWASGKNYAQRIVNRAAGPAPYRIRTHGDPVLKHACQPVTVIDDTIKRLAADMITTMYLAPGVGLAGNQVGVQKRIFVYDANDGLGARVVLNPEIVEREGELTAEEGCLSVPQLYFDIPRAARVVLRGMDLDGEPIEIEAADFHARILQHEFDHLEGKLLLERLDPDQRKQAMRSLREQAMRS